MTDAMEKQAGETLTELMAVLPEKVARKIAYENGEKLFKFYTRQKK